MFCNVWSAWEATESTLCKRRSKVVLNLCVVLLVVQCVLFSLHASWERLLKIRHGGTKITIGSTLKINLIFYFA